MITTEDGDAQVGVGMVIWDRPRDWSIEMARFHRPNVVICEVVTGKRNPLIGAYLASSTLDRLLGLEEVLTHGQDQNLIVLGGLNAEIQAHNPRSQKIVDLLMEFGLVDRRHHIGSAGGSDTGNMVSDA